MIIGLQEPERVVIGSTADELYERLSHDANGFSFVSQLGKVTLRGAQDYQGVRDLPLERSGLKTDKCRNRPDIGLRIGLRVAGHGNEDQDERSRKQPTISQ